MLLQISCDYQDSINNVWLWGSRTHTQLHKPPKQFSTLPPRLHQPKDCKRACDNTNSLGLAKSPKYKNSSSPAQSASNSLPAQGNISLSRFILPHPQKQEETRFPPYPCTLHPSLHLLRTESTWVLWPSVDRQMGNHTLHLSSPFSLVPGTSPLP